MGETQTTLTFQTLGGDLHELCLTVPFRRMRRYETTRRLSAGITEMRRTGRQPGRALNFLAQLSAEKHRRRPVGIITDISKVEPATSFSFAFRATCFKHSPVVVETGKVPSIQNIRVAAHTYDADNRSLAS
jgi:hypothetical protein